MCYQNREGTRLHNCFSSVVKNSSLAVVQEMQLLEIFPVKFDPLDYSMSNKWGKKNSLRSIVLTNETIILLQKSKGREKKMNRSPAELQ